ncbi:6252_t:CDS:2 [Gigaspora rosea]|nr:6252_t:CDS:2 [Gigaspora rosea]
MRIDWSKENEEHGEGESGTSKERKRKYETEEEDNQTWRVGSYSQGKKLSKRAELAEQRSRKQYSRKSSAETYSTITRRRKSEELQNNREEQKNIFKATLRVNSSQLQNTEKDTRAHNSSTLKMNRICKGKDKEVIAESSKKVPSKEDWSVEKDLMYKKSGSSLVDQIKISKHLEFKLACHNINGLKRNIQKFDISLDWMNKNLCDVLGLVETNISDKEGFFFG